MKKEKCQKIGKSKWFNLVVYSILAFVFVLPVTVHATEKINRAADSYTVKLPKSVDVSKNSMTFDVLVENNENHNVYITMDNSVPLKNDKKPNESVPLQVAFENGVKFGVNERKTATLTHGDLNAGKWNASLNVNIKAEANKYIFKFDGNGATSGTMADIPSSFGKEFILPECAFTKEYYTFEHYNLYKIENGVKKYYYMKEGTLGDSSEYRKWYEKGKQPEGWTISFPIPGSDIYSKVYNINDGETLYIEAQWEANRLTINYHADGATKYKDPNDGEVIKDITGKDIILTKEYLHNVQYNNGFIDSNRFSGKDYFNTNTNNWKSNKDSTTSINASNSGTGKELAEDVGLDLSKGNITVDFYPDWQMNVGTMHFYPNSGNNKGYEGSTIIDSGEYAGSLSRLQGFNYKSTSGNTVLDVLTLFEKTGYHTSSIQAWHLGSANSNEYIKDNEEDLSRFVKDSTNVHLKLYANWIPNTYSVKYDGNGATSGSVANSSHTYDSAKVLNKNSYVKTGYTFLGWSTDKSATKATYTDGQSVKNLTTTNGGNVTLYAVWEANTYTYNIKYVSSSGKSLGTSTVAGTYGSSKEVTPPAMTGYTSPAAQTVKFDSTSAKTITFTYTPVTYSITYNLGGGSVSGNPTSYNIESAAITLKNPTRTGYTFTGWTGSNGTTPSTSVSIPSGSTGNKSYTANWKINTYTLTYNANGGSVTPTSKSLTYGSQYGTLPTPTRTGYTFNGWYTAASGGTKVSSTTTIGAGNVTIYAQWTPNTYTYNIKYVSSSGKSLGTSTVVGTYGSSKEVTPPAKTGYTSPSAQTVKFDSTSAKTITFTYTPVTYSITYNLAGGSVSGNPTSYNIESSAITLKNPTRTGYTFTGWTGSNGTTASTSVSIPSGSTGNKSYTANWKINTYTLTYNANGGSVTPTSKTLTYGSQYGTLPTPTRTGYTFNGWYTAASGGTKVSSTTTIGAGNVTIYAQWTPNTYTYNIKYVSSSGKSLGTSTVVGTYGSSKEVTPPAKTGYTSPSAQTVKFDSTSAKTITFTYTPVTYSITYNLAGGSVSGNPTSYNIESSAITLKNPTRTGYTFTGWTGSNGTTASTSVSIPSGSTGNKSYTANWKINTYTLTYNANGGSVTPTSKTLTYGSQYGTLPTPTRTGYTFNGWYTAASGGTKVSSTTTIGAGNVTIYAQWTPNTYTYNIKYVSSSGKSLGTSTVVGTYGSSKEVTPPAKTGYTSPSAQTVKFDSTSAKTITFTYTPVTYSITYNLAGGSVSGNPTSYNIESSAITLKNPTRTGYTFTGWTGSNGTTASTSVSIPSGSTGNKSYTANWKINTYTLTYNANGGSVTPTSKTLTYGSQYGTLPTPTRTGYTFNGWYTAASGGTKVSSTTTIGASNTTIYAHWTKKLTYELVDGPTFNSKLVALMNKHLSVAEWEIIFTDQKSSGTLIHDFDKDGDGGIVAWVDENELIKAPMKGTVYISTQNSGQKVIANENSREMFAYRQKLTSLDVSNLDTSKVTDMSHMLAGSGFTSLDLSNFNTSNVTNMQQMFSNSYSLTSLDISNFNTSKVTNMLGMFKDNFSLTTLNLSNFNTSNVTNMGSMFNGCVKLTTLNLSNFNTSKVTNMNSMFSGCEKLTTLNLSNFNTSNVTNMNSMFNGCIELSSSITIMNPTITNYSEMFTNCSTASNSKFIVNYIDNTTKSVARKMVATKSYNSKVFLY